LIVPDKAHKDNRQGHVFFSRIAMASTPLWRRSPTLQQTRGSLILPFFSARRDHSRQPHKRDVLSGRVL